MLLLSSRLYRVAAATSTAVAFSLLPQAFSLRSMSSFIAERKDGTVIISPRDEASQSALVVISHGLGDTAEGFADVAEYLAKEMPYVKFVLPTAPTRPVTINMGMSMPAWYDIKGLDERSNEECAGLEDSRTFIETLLRTEHDTTQLPYKRMVLAGFSMGGALSVYTGMQLSQPLAGIVVLSGYVPHASQFQIPAFNVDIPILHCHGADDPMVPLPVAQKSKQLLLERGSKAYELKTYAGLQHSVNMDEMKDVLDFLQKVLPPDDTCKVQLKDPSQMSVKELKTAIRKAGLGQKAVGLVEKSEFVKLLQDYRSGNA